MIFSSKIIQLFLQKEIFLRLIEKKETYDGEPNGRRIRRVTTFWCLWTVCRSFMERILRTLMIVDLYGTAPRYTYMICLCIKMCVISSIILITKTQLSTTKFWIQHQLVLLILYFVFIFQPSEAQVQIRKGDMRVTKMMIMVLGFYFASYVPHVLILAFIGKLEYEPVGIIILERVRFYDSLQLPFA